MYVSPAEMCRINGWQAGDTIESTTKGGGDEKIRLRLTAIGEKQILCVLAGPESREEFNIEGPWNLSARAWVKVEPPKTEEG
jgi:endonuclease YncB( thermonuclease family)